MPSTFVLDPDAKLDYTVDWSDWLGVGDTISSSSWTITPTGPTLTLSTNNTTTATTWVDNATAGTSYLLTNHITTAQGREDDRTITLQCTQR